MADYLDPVISTFIAEADRYLGPVRDMAAAAAIAAEANDLLTKSVLDLNDALGSTTRSGGAAAGSLAGVTAALAGMTRELRDASADLMVQTALLGAMNDKLAVMQRDLADTSADLMMQTALLREMRDAMLSAAASAAVLAAAQKGAAASTAAGTAAAIRFGRFWFLGGMSIRQALHWIVMGTLEIAATALPALLAFGAAIAGMSSTFGLIKDRTQSLIVASGGYRNALLNSVGPLRQVGLGMGTLRAAMAPDAYIIFGAVINALSGHMGAFSKVAKQAGDILATFATKLSAELSGQLGTNLAKFFTSGVKYMAQWGQVIGNVGHAFVDAALAMKGVGQGLLDVLVLLSRAFLAIAGNPVGAQLIGIAAAMSAVYRYGKLLMAIWTWIGGAAAVTAVRTLVAEMLLAAEATGMWSAALTVLKANLLLLATSPAGIAIGVIAAGLAIWWAASRRVSDATTQLIGRVQAMPPTVANLTAGIGLLTGALLHGGKALGDYGGNARNAATIAANFQGDVSKLSAAITQQALKFVNLETALAQTGVRTGAVGAGMNAMAIQTALADAKVSQLNQALDQYMALVTGGTAGAAAFEQSLANIGQVAGTTANNLGTATGTMNLSAAQFAKSLSSFTGQGAAAWTNFDQVVGSTMPQLMDWFRQAATLGAATGTTVSKAALDMASAMVKWAGSNKTAQAEVLAFARAQGLSFRRWGDLQNAIRAQGAGQADLTRKINATTISLSDLSQMAKNTANILDQQMSTAIATAALNSTQFNTDLSRAMQSIQTGMPVMGRTATYWIGQMNQQADIAKQRATQAAQGWQSAAGSIARSAQAAAAALAQAKAQAQAFQAFLNSMHGRNLTVTTQFISAGGGRFITGQTGPAITPGTGHGLTGGGTAPAVVVHVHGSVVSGQQIAQVVQGALNRKTIRNGSTQLFIAGRQH